MSNYQELLVSKNLEPIDVMWVYFKMVTRGWYPERLKLISEVNQNFTDVVDCGFTNMLDIESFVKHLYLKDTPIVVYTTNTASDITSTIELPTINSLLELLPKSEERLIDLKSCCNGILRKLHNSFSIYSIIDKGSVPDNHYLILMPEWENYNDIVSYCRTMLSKHNVEMAVIEPIRIAKLTDFYLASNTLLLYRV